MDYVCSICGYRYETKFEKKDFEAVPEDWRCPICNAPKSAFQASK
jgi:rubredoxin